MQEPTVTVTSGIGTRFIALLVDSLIVGVALMVIITTMFAGMFAGIAIEVASRSESADISDERRVALMLQMLSGIMLAVLISMLITWGYFVLFTGIRGQTPGKMFMGIKVVDEQGNVPGIGRALLREVIGRFLSGIIFYLGYLWAAWDPRGQAWHDKIAGTLVVPVKAPQPSAPAPPPGEGA